MFLTDVLLLYHSLLSFLMELQDSLLPPASCICAAMSKHGARRCWGLELNWKKGGKSSFLDLVRALFMCVSECVGPPAASPKIHLLKWALNLRQGRPFWLQVFAQAQCQCSSLIHQSQWTTMAENS